MSSLATPRDETETEEDPFADAGSGSDSEERKDENNGGSFKVNVHALSSDDDAVTGEETENEETESNMDTGHAQGDDEIPPRSTSTPVSEPAATFKIVDIEDRGNLIFPPSGDDNSAHPAMQSGDADSAKVSEDNSARVVSRSASDAGSAIQTDNHSESGSGNNATPATAPGSSNPKSSSKKVTAMVKPPKIFAPPRIPAEADATPSSTYRSILEAKKQKA
jgi:hypothetical protein